MARAFCIVYDAGGQKGLKKHTDGRKEGATLLLLLSTPGVDLRRRHALLSLVLEPSFDAKPSKGSTVVFPPIPYSAGRRNLREKEDSAHAVSRSSRQRRPMAGTRHAIEPTRSRGQRRADGVESPRHRGRSQNFDFPRRHEGLPIKRGRRLLVCVFATKRDKAGRARPRRRPASAGPGPAARWTLWTWRTRAPGRRSHVRADPRASRTAPRSARRSAPASCPAVP